MFRSVLRAIDRIAPPGRAFAHCDVPCGLYEADAMLLAADTVVKMIEKIQALPQGMPPSEDTRNAFVRMVWTKEEHVRRCKEELLILWTDYFKPEHLAMFPDLHETFWSAAKLCSKAKQSVDMETAKELRGAVGHIAEMLAQAKGAAKK
ncbi:MAG: superoxide dismutase, Ni [Candidatus Terrybacteria bacterium]|nr:superoxide dismutase, Ni [Candidatus Terrybacteria bacterium]